MKAKPTAGRGLLSTYIVSKDWNYCTQVLFCTFIISIVRGKIYCNASFSTLSYQRQRT